MYLQIKGWFGGNAKIRTETHTIRIMMLSQDPSVPPRPRPRPAPRLFLLLLFALGDSLNKFENALFVGVDQGRRREDTRAHGVGKD